MYLGFVVNGLMLLVLRAPVLIYILLKLKYTPAVRYII